MDSWFNDNPSNTYATPARFQQSISGNSIVAPGGSGPWSGIPFREPAVRQALRGGMYSSWNAGASPEVPGNMDGTYFSSPSVPRGVSGSAAVIDLANGVLAGQNTSIRTLSNFMFLYSNYDDGLWGLKDISSGFPGAYLSEGQARSIMSQVYSWHGRDLSPNFAKDNSSTSSSVDCK